jgi:choline dehydrogenase-like flavoprotein
MKSYDIVTIGGGLAGSAIAGAMAAGGARVLVVERETESEVVLTVEPDTAFAATNRYSEQTLSPPTSRSRSTLQK